MHALLASRPRKRHQRRRGYTPGKFSCGLCVSDTSCVASPSACPLLSLKNELDIDRVAHRCAVRLHTRSESKSEKYVAQLSIVATIRRRIEAEQFRGAFLVDVEIRDEVVTSERRRRGERGKKELRRCRRIILRRPSACARTDTTSGSWTDTRADSSSGAGTSAACASSSRTCASSLHCGARRRSRCRDGRDWLIRCRLRFWRGDYRCRWRSNDGSCIGRRGLELDVLQSLSRCDIARSRASPSAACGTGTSTPKSRVSLESSPCRGINDEEQNERMSKKRGSGPFPPPLSLARYPDRRPISSIYVDG